MKGIVAREPIGYITGNYSLCVIASASESTRKLKSLARFVTLWNRSIALSFLFIYFSALDKDAKCPRSTLTLLDALTSARPRPTYATQLTFCNPVVRYHCIFYNFYIATSFSNILFSGSCSSRTVTSTRRCGYDKIRCFFALVTFRNGHLL